jgi:hypothetical protein
VAIAVLSILIMTNTVTPTLISMLTVVAENEDETGASHIPVAFTEERDAVTYGSARLRELLADGSPDVTDRLVAEFERDLFVVVPHAIAERYKVCVQTCELRGKLAGAVMSQFCGRGGG